MPLHQGGRKFKRYSCPGVYRSAPPESPPPGLRIVSLYRCLLLQVSSLALSGSKSHGGYGAYHFACLILTEVFSWIVSKGLTVAELQRPEEALACFEQARALNPNLEPAWFNKSVTLVNAFQRYIEALPRFQEAERLGYAPAAEGVALYQQTLEQG